MGRAVSFSERDRTPDDEQLVNSWGDRLGRLAYLYRYRSVRSRKDLKRFKATVVGHRIYFPSFEKLNDPFDGGVALTYDGTEAEIRTFWSGNLAEGGKPLDASARATVDGFVRGAADPATHARLREVQDEDTARRGVLCFAEAEADLPMWSYYADGHKGLCLRFLTGGLRGWEGSIPPIPVRYTDYPDVSFYRDTRFKRTMATLGTKSKAWEHEGEWRIVREAEGEYSFNPAALDRVIMGCRMEPRDKERIRHIVGQRKEPLELFEAQMAEREFKLIIRPAS